MVVPDDNDELHVLLARLYRSQQLNAELARMLKQLEWIYVDGERECPECGVSMRGLDPITLCFTKLNDHSTDCALAAILKKATTE